MKTAEEAQAQIKRDRAVARSFKRTFMKERKVTAHGGDVLARLREFCKADVSTVTEAGPPHDAIAMALNEGRRQVWNMINGYLQLDDGRLAQLDFEYQRMIASALAERSANGSSSS